MGTVYINEHFAPKNQRSFYRTKMDDVFDNHEKVMRRILIDLHAVHNELHYIASAHHEEFDRLKKEMTSLKKHIENIHRLSITNERFLEDIFDSSERYSQYVSSSLKANDESIQMMTDHLLSLVDSTESIEKELRVLDGLKNKMTQIQHDIINKREESKENMLKQLEEKLNETSECMRDEIISNLQKIEAKVDRFKNKSMYEFFQKLNPGTKINHMIVSGVKMELATFIHFDELTNQVKYTSRDGNLMIADCSNIATIEINTKKRNEEK